MKKAAVLILLGQSNASGHGKQMAKDDIIDKPLKNVYGLSRDKNQSYTNTELFWEGYKSYGMNLAEELDNTYSIANQLAKNWQESVIREGNEVFRDLYIVQIAIGSQGVTEKYMWYPKRPEKLVAGKLGTVDISLYSFSGHILSMLAESFNKMGMEYEIIGVHWRGGEEDANENTEYLKKELQPIYEKMISDCNRLLNKPPIILHRLCCKDWMKELGNGGMNYENTKYINSVFENMAEKFSNVSLLDARNYPGYDENIRGNNLYVEDAVHYSPEVNEWAAKCIIDNYKNRNGN